ncbi:hypothetical protein ACM39_16770 [Chryseobacterium sp. FH2]|uniref:hypothetical protein n=1 Tax=Chryseobacterium sp. FH2 TaxID=1674291 RepID=UPI00065AE880|nr:hypothetical protein [Chryseobacterium sp. FH2]KMQ65325.1 hypothetical protein ACM39_16770 [Chryseobacterium sp. FH2]
MKLIALFILTIFNGCWYQNTQTVHNTNFSKSINKEQCLHFTDETKLCNIVSQIRLVSTDSVLISKKKIRGVFDNNFGKGFFLFQNEKNFKTLNNDSLEFQLYTKYKNLGTEPTAISIRQNNLKFYFTVLDSNIIKELKNVSELTIEVFVITAYFGKDFENVVIIDKIKKE